MPKDRVYFAPIAECNQDCLFCVRKVGKETVEGPIKTLSKKECFEKIEKYAREGWKTLVLGGGEPTLRDDLPELIKHAARTGFKGVQIQTNGVRLADKKYAEKIVNALLECSQASVSVSLHSHKRGISEKLTRAPNTFNKTIKGIKNLLTLGCTVSLYHILTKYNQRDVPGFVDFVHSELSGVKAISFSFIFPFGAARKNTFILPQLSKLKEPLRKALRLCDKYGILHNISTCGTIPLCFMQDFEGDVLNPAKYAGPEDVKLVSSVGEVPEKNATEEFHRATKTKPEKCSLCLIEELCPGLWNAYIKEHGVSELEPVTSSSSYPNFFFKLNELDKAFEMVKGEKGIFFIDFDVEHNVSVTESKKLLSFIKKISEKKLNYLIKRPLPLHLAGVSVGQLLQLRVPLNCYYCKDLFSVENGEVTLCTGFNAGKIEKFNNRREIFNLLKKKPQIVDRANAKNCWMRKYLSD